MQLTSVSPLDVEGEVLDADVVVLVLTAVRLPEPQVLVAEAEVDDLLSAAVGRIAHFLVQAEWPEHCQIEGERSLDVAYCEVDVMNRA